MPALPAADLRGYNSWSIALHWLSAVAIIFLFFQGEAASDNRTGYGIGSMPFHIGFGMLVGVLLLWRVGHRIARGAPADMGNRARLLNWLAKIVQLALLAAIVASVVSGPMLLWSNGRPVEVFGWVSVPSFMARNHFIHEIFEKAHEIASHAFIPLLALHIVGYLKHAFVDKSRLANRMFRADPGGY